MTARQRARAVLRGAAVAHALLAAGCTEVGTDPRVPLSIRLEHPAAAAVVEGDSLRDSTGAVTPLRAAVFNYRNQPIIPSPAWFLTPDTGTVLRIASATGIVTAGLRRVAAPPRVRIVAQAGGLQSAVDSLFIVPRPDSVRLVAPPSDTVFYYALDAPANASPPLQVRVLHTGPPQFSFADTVVRSWIVRYQIESAPPAATDSTLFFVKNGVRATADTTDATGLAGLQLRVRPQALAHFPGPADSVVVRVLVRYIQPVSFVGGASFGRFVVQLRPHP